MHEFSGGGGKEFGTPSPSQIYMGITSQTISKTSFKKKKNTEGKKEEKEEYLPFQMFNSFVIFPLTLN